MISALLSIAPSLSWMPLDAQAASQVPPPNLAVWWDRDYLTEIKSISDCTNALDTWRPAGMTTNDYYTVDMTMPDGSIRECKTVAEWLGARSKGGYAASTLDMAMESHFDERLLAYSVLPHLLPAKVGGFESSAWSRDAKHLVTADDNCVSGSRVKPAEVKWEFEPNRCFYEDESEFECARVLARGDYDGDGSLDLVVSTGGGYQQGSLRHYGTRLFTRRPSGRIVETSARLLDGMPDEDAIKEHRLGLAASFGLPEGIPIKLSGTLGAGDRTLLIDAEITINDGFVTGSYQYRKIGKPISIEGTLGVNQGIYIAEYALDEQPNARFALSWKRDSDRLLLQGHWWEAMETSEVKLEGVLPKQSSASNRTSDHAKKALE